MSAEILREAAKKLREVAESPAKRSDNWEAWPENDFESLAKGHSGWVAYAGDPQYAMIANTIWPDVDKYIALMHPPVALTLADWLDKTAAVIENFAQVYVGAERIDDYSE